MRVSAYFYGSAGSMLDKACRSIFENHGGKSIGAGTMLVGPGTGERDVEYDVPDSEVESVKAALVKAGFRLSRTPFEQA